MRTLALLLAMIVTPADWRKETFMFPLAFAPSIPYEGTEHVRFTPSWDQFDTESGFSYVFLWELKAKPVTTEDLEDYVEAYFNGLMSNVARARKVPGPLKTSASLHPMTAIPRWAQAHGAEVRTSNSFSKGEALRLHGEIAQRECGPDRMQIFFAMSMARRDRPIWEALRAARDATTCEAPVS